MSYSQVLLATKKVNIAYNSLLPFNFENDKDFVSQFTIASPVSFSGIGLHTGKLVHVKLVPAPIGTGIVFCRTDANHIKIPAHYKNVVDTSLSTVIASSAYPDIKIGTIEHLMSALAGHQINNIIIECNGPEIPVLDGSSAKFSSLLSQVGRHVLYAIKPALKIMKTIRVHYKDAYAELSPSPKKILSLSLSIDFPASIIGKQKFDMDLTSKNFEKEIAFCRTFTFKEEIDNLHKMGLAKGGSLQNAIVVDNNTILNPEGLYCSNEFVKHKMLDAIGDLSLIGYPIYGKFSGYKSGHKLNNQLLHALMKDDDAWSFHALNYQNIGKQNKQSAIIQLNQYPQKQEA